MIDEDWCLLRVRVLSIYSSISVSSHSYMIPTYDRSDGFGVVFPQAVNLRTGVYPAVVINSTSFVFQDPQNVHLNGAK